VEPIPDSSQRFSSRVDAYLRFRPRYPSSLLSILREETGLEPQWTIADVGSGTGFSSEPFLNHGNKVFAIEPNAEMRSAAELRFRDRSGFVSIAGSAEATGLPDDAVELVMAGQAFHWFDRAAARAEFSRVLRLPRWVALFWNSRLLSESGFAVGYESLLREFGTDYAAVRHDRVTEGALETFFGGRFARRTDRHEQHFDLSGLTGRLLSSSYTPETGHPRHAGMLAALRSLFDEHEKGGQVTMSYELEIYVGRLGGRPFRNVWPTEL